MWRLVMYVEHLTARSVDSARERETTGSSHSPKHKRDKKQPDLLKSVMSPSSVGIVPENLLESMANISVINKVITEKDQAAWVRFASEYCGIVLHPHTAAGQNC